MSCEVVFPADEWGQSAGAAAPSAAARPYDAVERHRLGHALEVMRAPVLGDEQPGRLPLHARGDEDRPGLGRGLHPRRDIRRLAEHFAGRVDDDRAAIEADAGRELGRAGLGVPGVEVGEGALDRERRPHRPFGVVLLRVREAEQRHQPVAELLQHVAAQARHRRGGLVEIRADQIAPVLRIHSRREARRADEIAEHDRDRPPLGEVGPFLPRGAGEGNRPKAGGGGRRGGRRRLVRGESGDRPHQPLAMPERHADLLEVGLGQVGQDVRVDLMLAEQRFVLSEADAVQPLGDVHLGDRLR